MSSLPTDSMLPVNFNVVVGRDDDVCQFMDLLHARRIEISSLEFL